MEFDKQELITLELALSLAIKRNESIKDIDATIYLATKTRFEDIQKKIWKVIYAR